MKASVRIWLGLIVLFCFLLGGCAMPLALPMKSSLYKDYSLDDKKEMGIVIVSLTRSGYGGYRMYLMFRALENEFKGATGNVYLKQQFKSLDWECPKYLFKPKDIPEENPCGRLAVFELPQGEYEFYSWRGSMASGKYTEWIEAPGGGFSKKFSVIAGKGVYIGNMHISLRYKMLEGRLFPYRDYRYRLETSDMRERDLLLFYSKHPLVTPDKVVIDILK